jgi:S1-C subfamily serine protease
LPYLSDKVAIALAVAALATMVANPIEQKIIPLSEDEIVTLESSAEINESFRELEAFRSENFSHSKGLDSALYDIQTIKRALVAEYQSSQAVFPNGATVDGKITERDITRAATVIEEYRGAVLILSQNSGNWGGVGTAFRISPDLVLTNAHNIGAMNGSLPAGIRFNLTDINGVEYEAKFLGADGTKDIALLRLNESNYDLPYFSMDNWSRSYTKDEIVVSVGHPSLLGYWTPTIGTTPMGGMYSEDDKGNRSYTALANLNITSGASGSPIFDLNGNLEGILFATIANPFKAGTEEGYQVAPYLQLSGIATYSLAYDLKDKVLEWSK